MNLYISHSAWYTSGNTLETSSKMFCIYKWKYFAVQVGIPWKYVPLNLKCIVFTSGNTLIQVGIPWKYHFIENVLYLQVKIPCISMMLNTMTDMTPAQSIIADFFLLFERYVNNHINNANYHNPFKNVKLDKLKTSTICYDGSRRRPI